ncbi:MAG: redoxin domain-containing protein [Limisphaerales bacterium]
MKPLSLTALLCCLAASLPAAEPEHPVLPLGSPAPDFQLPGVDGEVWSLARFADSPILAVVFTCNHCPTAQAYEERLKRLTADYQGRGVAVVAINPNSPEAVRLDELGYSDLDDTLDSMKLRAAERSFNFPYLDDGPAQQAARAYGPVATPHVFIFDQERKLRYQGRIDDAEREDLVKRQDARLALDALLTGTAPAPAQTKVFGCSTKWKDKADGNRKWLAKIQAEPVDLTAADGSALSALRSNAGPDKKVRLVHAWATWCGPCVTEFDEVLETNLRFRHRDFEMVTVAAQFPDEHDKVLAFLKKHHASTRNLLFGDTDKYKLIEALDPEWSGALPHTLLIAPGGEVLLRHTGPVDLLELRRKIVPALDAITPWGG